MNYLTAILAFPLFNILILFEFFLYWRAPEINNPLNLRLTRAYLVVSSLQTISVWFWFFGFLFSKVNSVFGEGFAPGEECNCFGLVGAEVVLSIFQWIMSCTTAYQAMYILQINLQGEAATPSIKRRRRAQWNAVFITFCSLLAVYTVLSWITAHNRRCPQGQKYLVAFQHHFYPTYLVIDMILYGATAHKLTHIHGHLELSAPSTVMSNHNHAIRTPAAPGATTRTSAVVNKARALFLSFGSSGFLQRSPSTPLSGAQSPTVELLPHHHHHQQPLSSSPSPVAGGPAAATSSPAAMLLLAPNRGPTQQQQPFGATGTGASAFGTRSQLAAAGQVATRTARQTKASQNIQEMVKTYKLAFVVTFITGVLGVIVFFLQFVAQIPEFTIIACLYCLLMYIGYVARRTPFLIVWCKWTPPARLMRILTCGRARRRRNGTRQGGPGIMSTVVHGRGSVSGNGNGGMATTRTVEVSSALSYHSVGAGQGLGQAGAVGGGGATRTVGTIELQSSGGTAIVGRSRDESRRGSGFG